MPEPLSVPPDTVSVNDQFQVTDWAFATPPRASRDVNAIVFAKKRTSNSLQLAIGGFDSASALVAFVSNWVKHAKLFLMLKSRSTIGVNYPGALCSMAAFAASIPQSPPANDGRPQPGPGPS